MVNGYSIVTYQRPLRASDELDRNILTNQSQAIIWAIGPLNQRNEVSFHSQYTKKNQIIDFGRPAKWNCPLPEADSSSSSSQSQSPAIVQTVSPAVVQQRRRPEEDEPSKTVETTTKGRTNERRRGGNREVICILNANTSENQINISSRSVNVEGIKPVSPPKTGLPTEEEDLPLGALQPL